MTNLYCPNCYRQLHELDIKIRFCTMCNNQILVIDNKIKECTEIELYEYWLKRYDDIISFDEYKSRMIRKGVIIYDS